MKPAGRVGDIAFCPSDSHGCPGCAHPVQGPAIQGSPNVLINDLPALRVGDPGIHAACCGGNKWRAAQGASTVLFNDKRVHRQDDQTSHCGGTGRLMIGSANVLVGDDSNVKLSDTPHERKLTLRIKDGTGRGVYSAVVKVVCPHHVRTLNVSGDSVLIDKLCEFATLHVSKWLQRGERVG